MKQSLLLLLTALLSLAPSKCQEPALQVTGAVKQPLRLDTAALQAMPRVKVTAEDHGKKVEFEGVPVHELLRRAGAPVGSAIHGKAMSLFLVAEGRDGYRAVLTLADVDPGFRDNVALVADRADGQPLPGQQGPLRLIVPGEKRAGRWVRMLVKLEVRDAAQ